MTTTPPKEGKSPARIAAGKASQLPEYRAIRIAREFHGYSANQQALIKAALVPVLCPEHGSDAA